MIRVEGWRERKHRFIAANQKAEIVPIIPASLLFYKQVFQTVTRLLFCRQPGV
jgi:hypothetical protein